MARNQPCSVSRLNCHSVLQCVACVAVCCSVLQCVAVCCSMLQCVAACCGVYGSVSHLDSHILILCCNMGECVARNQSCSVSRLTVIVCCSVLQCVAVCRSMLQCVAVCCSVLRCVWLGVSFGQSYCDIMLQCVSV